MIDINFFDLFKDIIVTSFGIVWAILKYFWWVLLLVLLIKFFPDIIDYLLNLLFGRKEIEEVKENKKYSKYSEALFKSLFSRGLPVELEKFDGHKTIDIACVPAKLNIEIDGIQHAFYKQAVSDLKRTYYSLEKDYYTLRIPNNLIKNNSEEVVDWVEKIIKIRIEKNK